jgi:hypothetical protein
MVRIETSIMTKQARLTIALCVPLLAFIVSCGGPAFSRSGDAVGGNVVIAIGDKPIDELKEMLNDIDPATRLKALHELGNRGTAANSATYAVQNAAKNDPDPSVRDAAATTLSKISKDHG